MRALLVGLLLVAVVIGLLWGLQRRLIYLPMGEPAAPAEETIEGAVDVTLRTSDGLELAAWHIPASGGRTVLVANGNAGHRGLRAPLAEALADEGLGVLLFDYRGYGGNPGSPTEDGLARDVRAARQFLVEGSGLVDDELVAYGESLGAAVVAEMAKEHPPSAIVLRSPFTDLASVGRHHYPFLPVRALLRDRLETARHLSEVEVPTTVALGTADRIVPPSESRAVAAAAAGPVRVVEVAGADHNDTALLNGPELVEAILDAAARERP